MNTNDLNPLRAHIASRVIGQQKLVDSMLVCLLSDGHLLVVGLPGLAKTTAVNALAEAVEGDFHRIQFTPDLLPSDLVGTDIYRHEKAEFEFRPGPLFHNILLADEVNRAPAKVQAALRFVKSGPGRRAIVTSLEKAAEALHGRAGTELTA